MQLCLFLGCNTPAIRPDVERAIRASMPVLGLIWWMPTTMSVVRPSVLSPLPMRRPGWRQAAGIFPLPKRRGVIFVVQCGSCYSSLRMGREHLMHDAEKLARANELLEPTGRRVTGQSKVRHVSEVLFREIGPEKIASLLKKSLQGLHGIVQYPCHTCTPVRSWGLKNPPGAPGLAAVGGGAWRDGGRLQS